MLLALLGDMTRRRSTRSRRPDGFSLIEVLVAVLLVGGTIAALGQLVMMASRANAGARAATIAAVLATQKMEQLRADADRLAIGGSLQADIPGYADALDAEGLPSASQSVSFVRRWAIAPLPFDPLGSRVLRVRVLRIPGASGTVPAWPGMAPDESRLLTVITAKER